MTDAPSLTLCSWWVGAIVAVGLPLFMLAVFGLLVFEMRWSRSARLQRRWQDAQCERDLRRLEQERL